jgi:formiminotetrahydrofolate cyclodeaminase
MGAQAAALISMVCNLTLGKPKYAAVEADLQALLLSSEQLRSTLTGMIKTDIEVFDKLMSSYALPKTTDDEKAQRSVRIQAVLKEATQVPLDCAKACAKTLALSRIAAEKGNAGVVSDAGVALMSAYSGLKSAALNVYINAAGLKDREFAEEKLAELQEISQDVETEVASIYALVKERL